MTTDFLAELEQRRLVHQVSDPEIANLLRTRRMTGYIGFDPTANSLHVGSLLPLLTLVRFQRAGHQPICLLGGGTGLIGDPSGRTSERSLLAQEQLEINRAGLRRQVEQFLDFGPGQALLVDNAEWLGDLKLLDFLRDIGKHFSVNQMINRESVRARLEQREHGISYTEFTYMLLQAYDFLALHDRCGCILQMGGSDQWGNIVSGTDLIRRLRGVEAYGITQPLVTRADGKKFGKSEEGNVWLDPQRTSPYQFYQFWINVEDADVVQYLMYFTFLPLEEIRAAELAVKNAPDQRAAQKLLAREVTRLVHGPDGLARAERATQAFFSRDFDFRQLSAQELDEAFRGNPVMPLDRGQLGGPAAHLAALLADCGLYPSRSRARQDIPAGAVSVNNRPVRDPNHILSAADLLPGGFVILRKGKKHYQVVRVTG